MSDPFTFYAGNQSSIIDKGKISNISYQYQRSKWYPREPITWTPDLRMEILSYFNRIEYPLRRYEDIPFKEPLRSEIRRFFISLDAYIESSNPVIPYRDILYGAADPGFSEYLKRVKRKSYLTTWYAELFAIPDWWDSIPSYSIKDIGDIFNYSYLIFWNQDTDDYLHGFSPVNLNHDWVSKFREAVRSILPDRDSFDKVDIFDTITEISSSISIERGTMKHLPHYMIKNKYTKLSKIRHTCDRSVIPVSPNNIRDSVLNDPGDLNTISVLDRQVMEVLRRIPGHIHLRDKDEVSRRYKHLNRKYRIFLHRDMKKEGITKPRELLKVMLEVLHDEYPDIEVFGYTSFYDNFCLMVNGERKYPSRGHGLGMANSLTTLMQLAIHELVTDELLNDIPDLDTDLLCLNDDFVAGFNMEYHIESYWDKEDEVMQGLCIIREPTKSFISYRQWVLAERYHIFDEEYEKESYQRRELLYPLVCANITHAKEYFSSAQTYVKSKFVSMYIGEIQNYWGYEFFPSEFSYPTILGGWINEKINGVDMSLILMDQLPLKSYVYRGFKATNTKVYKPYRGELYSPPVMQFWGCLNIPEKYWESFDILPKSHINWKYGRILSRSRQEFDKYWSTLYRIRQKVFKVPFEMTYKDLIISIQNKYNNIQFYPNDSMINRYHLCNIWQGNIKDIFIDPNPKLGVLAKYNPSIKYPFKEDFSIQFSTLDSSTKKSESLFSKEVQRALKSDIISSLCTGRYHEIYYPKDDYHPEEQYLNPVKIGEVTAFLKWGQGYPEIYPDYEHPLINSKREIYNRLFSIDELFLLDRCNLNRENIKIISDFLKDNPEESIQSIIEYLSVSYEGENEFKLPVQKEEEDKPDNILDWERFISNPGLLYAWRSDRDYYTVTDERLLHVLQVIGAAVTELTFPGLRTTEQCERIVSEIYAGRDGMDVAYFARVAGLEKLIQPADIMEAWASDEEVWGLFDNG